MPQGPNFVPFTLQSVSFQAVARNLEKSALTDPQMYWLVPRSRIPMCMLQTPPKAQIFIPFGPAIFSVMAQIE